MTENKEFELITILDVMSGQPGDDPAALDKQEALIGFMYGREAVEDATGILYAAAFRACQHELGVRYPSFKDYAAMPAAYRPTLMEMSGFEPDMKISLRPLSPEAKAFRPD